MDLTAFFESSLVIQFHVYAAIAALALGAFVLFRRKGGTLHKYSGRLWVLLMASVALSSFWIHEIKIIGPFSPIHLLSILVLTSLITAILAVRRGNVTRHQRTMKSLFFGGLIIPGLFTFLPGRLMSEVFIEPMINVDFVDPGQSSFLDQTLDKTPFWVWPLLLALTIVGLLHTRKYSMPKARIFILPITFSITAIIASVLTSEPLLSIGVVVCAIVATMPLGERIASRSGAFVNAHGRLEVPGEWITISLLAIIFLSRFVKGFASGANPELAGGLTFTVAMAVISGLTVGIAVGRTKHYLSLLNSPNGGPALPRLLESNSSY